MNTLSKRVLYGSIGLAAAVVAASVVDILTGLLFARSMTMDICFLIGAGIVIYMAVDSLQDQK
jgi:putative Ca2+/H+ antiporter (TMEM165/GDT1 family)